MRASYAVSRNALNDAGVLTLAVPRPIEARAYDLTRLALDGAAEVRTTFSVETLLTVAASGESDAVIGMTADDLYLIREGTKSRFLSERRILYVASALSWDGRSLIAAFSDVAGSSFALAYGDIGGRVAWLREADGPLSAAALSPDGEWIAQASDNGKIWLFDSARRDFWTFAQDEPVRAVVCTPDGKHTAYATSRGSVGLIDREGSRQWEARLPGEALAIALADNASLCAVITYTRGEEPLTRLYLLDGAGRIGWEHEAEHPIVALAMSPNGEYVATSTRNGMQTVYHVIAGDRQAPVATGQDVIALLSAPAPTAADTAAHVQMLRSALKERPTEVTACERLIAIQAEQTALLLAEAREFAERQEFAAAAESLERLWAIAPEEPELYTALRQNRALREQHEMARADSLLEEGQTEVATAVLTGILSYAPLSLEARRRLAALEAREVRNYDEEAELLLNAGDYGAALDFLERAQRRAPSSDRAAKIRKSQIALELSVGMAHYNEKRYQEAIFQFRKVLAYDPTHSEAKRYLNFAQRFGQDSNEAINDRFGRLE